MPIITRLQAGKRDQSRVNLFVDGKFEFSLPAEVVLKESLRVDLNLTELELNSLRGMGDDEKLFAKILNFLSYRPRSKREIENRLKRYLYKEDNQQETISKIIARLEELSYIDDLAFATWFVESRMSNNPRSSRHLTSELMEKELIAQSSALWSKNSQTTNMH